MIGRTLGLMAGMGDAVDGLRSGFLTANFMFAIVLLVFVVFICIRMLRNTKSACLVTASGIFFVLFYVQLQFGAVLPALLVVIRDSWRSVGAAFCVFAAVAVVKGLADEEKRDEYVHHRLYWGSWILLMYAGLFLVSGGMTR